MISVQYVFTATVLMSNILLDYLQLSTQYQVTYGPDTVLLYMVGSFYEIYSLMHLKNQEISDIVPIVEVCDICNLNIANKQSQIGKNTDPSKPIPRFVSDIVKWQEACPISSVVMAGFRDYSIEKYIEKLVEAKYTVVVYDQEKTKEDGKTEIIRRVLANIYSPGTFLSTNSSSLTLTNNIMCVWIEQLKSSFVCGIANINIITAETHMFEYTSAPKSTIHQHTSFDELERIITVYQPSEVIFITNIDEKASIDKIRQFISLSEITKVHVLNFHDKSQLKIQNCMKQIYIHSILLQIFPSNDSIVNDPLFHTNPTATQAFCYLIDFIQEHNKDLVKRIQMPCFTNQSTRLMLANQTLRQLNIISTGRTSGHLSSIEQFLNKCVTPMGKRLFKYQLLHPTFDEKRLNHEYNAIDDILNEFKSSTNELKEARAAMSPIRDIDKLLRQLVSNKLSAPALYALYKTCEAYHTLSRLDKTNVLPFLDAINQKIDISNCCSEEGISYLQHGTDSCLDALQGEQMQLTKNLEQIAFSLESVLKIPSSVKLHETEKYGISLQVTKKRGTLLRTYLAKEDSSIFLGESIVPSTIKIVSVSNSCDEIHFPFLDDITNNLLSLKGKIKQQTEIAYQCVLKSIEADWYDFLTKLSDEIARYDVLLNKAFISRELNFCRPQIVQCRNNTGAYVDAKKIRHPLIEHIQTRESYVPNDICLEQEGMLLTGYNGIGKTSLLRALGISIVLAQSGNFVPAQEFVYQPYQSLFCNIEKNDNLFKNMSTFQLEMSELRVILRLADNHSLILGDELMNSTEIQSGLSIMVALVQSLSKKRATFLIATHFNQLADYVEIQELDNIQMRHMSVTYDLDKQSLVYDRILKEGFGSRSYGLEVARSLCMTNDFIEGAFQIRNKYFPESQGTLSYKTTCYSAQKIRGICEQCNLHMSTEVHHVLEQHDADKNGFIGHIHKNHPSNLMSLCEHCHAQKHV